MSIIKNFLKGIILSLAFCIPLALNAAESTATARLSSSTTETGEPVELELKIVGQQSLEPPRFDVKGLKIRLAGQQTYISQSMQGTELSCTFTYQVMPDQAGDFTIPAIEMEIAGKKISSNAVTLKVTAPDPKKPKSEDKDNLVFLEFVVPKQTAYVGEPIPAEVRLYVDQRVRVSDLSLGAALQGTGFNIQQPNKMDRPTEVDKNGRRYQMVALKCLITPLKSGKLTMQPVEMQLELQVPVQGRGPQMPGMPDDMYMSPFTVYQPRRGTVSSKEIDFEIKSLPKENQPKSFSGTVGQFTMTTEASPLKLKSGDPITMKFKISGRGNFDTVKPPVMAEEDNWKSYPPSGKFTQDDDLGISGAKAFEMALIPLAKKTKLPAFEFSYFDPVAEKYVILKSEDRSIAVEEQSGAMLPQATPGATQPASEAETAKNTADIHYILTGPAHWGQSFVPLFQKTIFWTAQGVPALALLAFVGFQIRQRKGRDLLAKQLSAWRREQQDLMRVLQRDDADQAGFYDAAVRYIQIASARGLRQSPESIGPAEAVAANLLDETTAAGVQSIFDAHGELHYAGASMPRQKVSPARRQEVLEVLRRFENAS